MLNIFKYFKTNSKLKRQLNDANNRIFNLTNKLLKQKRLQTGELTKLTKRVSDQKKHINSLNKKIRRTQGREHQLIKEKEALRQRIFGKKPRSKVIPFKLSDNAILKGWV